MIRTGLLISTLFSSLALSSVAFASAKQVAIIIDDVGYRATDAAILELPEAVTFSVFAFSPHGPTLAARSIKTGHEIMIHQPMQSLNGLSLGEGALTNTMDQQQVQAIVSEAIHRIPNAKGMNNHMGSFLTQLPQTMNWVMQSLKPHQLYFIDSYTSRYSQAGVQAMKTEVPTHFRHVFLDNDLSESALDYQFQRMIKLTEKQDQVIAIAHPHPQTIDFLKRRLPELKAHGIELQAVSQLIAKGSHTPPLAL